MENKKTNLSEYNTQDIPEGTHFRIGIIVSEWNSEITDALFYGAYETLLTHKVPLSHIIIKRVPGAFELTTAASVMLSSSSFDAVLCLGCIIKGETPHFDFISQAVAHGITQVSIQKERPVIFGVLTTLTMEQALDRAGGKHGNKGVEAAVTALKMAQLCADLRR